jgi:hypothetical protein
MVTEYTGEVTPLKEYTGDVVPLKEYTGEVVPIEKSAKKNYVEESKSHDIIGNVAQGIAEPVAAMVTGAVAKPVSELAGLAAIGAEGVRRATGGKTSEPIDAPAIQEKVRGALTYEPKSAAGQSAYNPLNAIPMAIGKGIAAVTPERVEGQEASTLKGALKNVASEAVPQAFGLAGAKFAPKAAAPVEKAAKTLRKGAEGLMQSALKPTPKDLLNGRAAQAIDTMLEKGIPATPKGVEQIRARIEEINTEIKDAIANSPERVETAKLMRPVAQKLKAFKEQANPNADMKAIRDAWEEFKNHPVLKSGEGAVKAAEAKVADREAAAAKALQTAGKLKTFEEQQKNLAHGGSVKSSVDQPEGQPYINVGGKTPKKKFPLLPIPFLGCRELPVNIPNRLNGCLKGLRGIRMQWRFITLAKLKPIKHVKN